MAPLLTGEVTLLQAEADLLDALGNQNGHYDVGDLRAYLFGP